MRPSQMRRNATTENIVSRTEKISARMRGLLSNIGPGIFILGYIIGTGSVTAMATAGARFGLSLTWALALSCFFTYVMLVSISRVTIATGETLLFTLRKSFGGGITLFIIIGLMLTEVTSIMGVMGIASDVVLAWSEVHLPVKIPPVWSAVFFTAILYALFWNGSHGFFLKAMATIVAVMSLSFLLTLWVVFPPLATFLNLLKPGIPSTGDSHLILAGLVGTTMASVCLVTRSYLVAEVKCTLDDLNREHRDAAISLALTLLVSGAIMASAALTMFPRGLRVESAIDMVQTLEPLAGAFASTLFVIGILAAALSSLFPNYVLAPWLITDFMNLPRDMSRFSIRMLVLVMTLLGLVVPIFGGSPVIIMIASQAVSPVIMPLLIVLVLVLLN